MNAKWSIALLFGFCAVLGLLRTDGSLLQIGGKKPVELNFWNGFTGPDGRVMLGMIRDFNEKNPDIHVSMQRMAWATYYNKLMVAAVDDRGPQLFVIHASTLPRMQRAGFLSDLSEMYQGPSRVPTEDFEPYVLQQVKFDGKYLAIPLDIHPQGMYVNTDILKNAGIVDDQGNARPPATREEFLKVISTTKKLGPDNSTNWGFSFTNWQNNFQTLLPQFDGKYVDENGKAALDCPGNIAALKFMAELSKKKLIPPPQTQMGWIGFRQKKVAIAWEGVYMLGDLKSIPDLKYVGCPIPTIGNHEGTMADSHTLCIRKGIPDREREAAKRFIAYLSQHSIDWANAGQVPARRSLRETDAFKKMPVQVAFAKQIPHMMYPPRTPVLFELGLEVGLAVEKVIRGRTTPEEALHIANINTQRVMDRDKAEQASRKVTQ